MFLGEYSHTIDDKGRMAVPAKFRNTLQSGAVVTRGLDNCLFLFSKEEWRKLADQIAGAPINKANTRAFGRFMLAGAMEAEFDRQGRILLPEYLRQYANLRKQAIVAGLYNRIEIWEEGAWKKYSKATEKNSGRIAEGLGELGM
ncbi:cell division/cell wall cluster transcriptional repressor MraZ [Candidatus Falkowbacteria bacterium RIFOXYC2_FULL_47_12]|uniref:Transcriptional regulator MraZ n=2 Tax=Candidatus Falkowiibacteriota TaxID=1752728 RepID=A0A1F5TS19_9BACT|nr:MAG: cell division/cell wall cluster transcriptional repressor MraZ [Candidatus Falkowbacteria bacterium RIFOXYA2_FULL_47_9]OGF41391.1 MAG: cell division/cell wall cluster transcriptional repressor MraZ [Candidatus Falkowbacteria bacterium RIFOXYC2_FULL_47_12]